MKRNSKQLETTLAGGLLACSLMLFGALQFPTIAAAEPNHHSMNSTLPREVLFQKLDALRAWSARLYDLEDRLIADYNFLITVPGATSPDGCISDAALGGMGYHYTVARDVNGDGEIDTPLLNDAKVSLLEPEFLVYFPRGVTQAEFYALSPQQRKDAMKLVAFDYFIPYAFAPGPEDGGQPPTFEELGGLQFMPSRFGGWMAHIWLWADNPNGMFANWNPEIPLCANSPF